MTITAKLVRVRALGVIAGLVLLGSATGLITTSATAATRAPPGGNSVNRRVVPSPGSTNTLNGVWCTSSTNCLAVGDYKDKTTTAALNQAQKWNGTSWSVVSIPSPGGNAANDSSGLASIACTSSSNCWAVGPSLTAGDGVLTMAMRWNGTSWSQVTTPNPQGVVAGDINTLTDVTCTSATNCWAFGEYGNSTHGVNTFSSLALRWNGTTWSKVTTPNPGGSGTGISNVLLGGHCVSSTDCWAVGGYNNSNGALLTFAVHWNGSAWTKFSTPNPGGTALNDDNALGRVTCTSTTNCFAVGGDGNTTTNPNTTTSLNLVERWNGTTWSQVATPNPSGTATNSFQNLQGVYCNSATDCWTVGSWNTPSFSPQNEALRWNGSTWSLVTTPDPGGTAGGDFNHFDAVYCTSTTNCQTVGNYEVVNQSQVNEAMVWNGSIWTNE
jgi:hypothetical protein